MNRHKLLVAIPMFAACVDQELHTNQIESFSFYAKNEAFDYYGYAVATADFNGDGNLDLAVGAPGEGDEDYGLVYIYSGDSGGGLGEAQKLSALSFGYDHDTARYFGAALTVGDFDGDKRMDLAVGAPATEVDGLPLGAVFVLRGTDEGLVDHRVITPCSEMFDNCKNVSWFGGALAAGRIVEHFADSLVIGAPETAVNPAQSVGSVKSGAVFIVHRPGEGFKGTVLHGTHEAEEFGYALAVGDLNDDGRADIAVGAPGFANDAGRVVLYAGRTPPETQPSLWSAMATYKTSVTAPIRAAHDRFGHAVAIANLESRTSTGELAVGAPGADTTEIGPSSGVVRTYDTSENGTGAWTMFLAHSFYGLSANGEFGKALATGRVASNNGNDDLVIGAPGQDAGGRVLIYNGTTMVESTSQTELHSPFPTEQGDQFGASLCANGGRLVIGVPGESPEVITAYGLEEDPNAGAVEWVKSSLDGAAFLHQEVFPN